MFSLCNKSNSFPSIKVQLMCLEINIGKAIVPKSGTYVNYAAKSTSDFFSLISLISKGFINVLGSSR